MDAIGTERQFIDHIAPVWRALPDRGAFLVDRALMEYAAALGIDALPIDADQLRNSSRPPLADPGDGPAALVASIGDTKIGRRLGYRRFAFMEHGCGQAYLGERSEVARRNPSYAGGLDREDTELFLCPNEYSAALWASAYPAARVEIVGSPRLDDLPAREPDGRVTVALSWHWPVPASLSPEAGTALGHYIRAFPDLAREFNVIGHAHPKSDWPRRVATYYRRAGIPFVADFADVCRQADVYVCDNSSTLFEFAATGRPVVVLNAPQFRRNVKHGGRFWDWADVGIQVDEPDQLIPAIREALEDAPARRERRETVLRDVFAYRGAEATERAVGAVLAWQGATQAVAA